MTAVWIAYDSLEQLRREEGSTEFSVVLLSMVLQGGKLLLRLVRQTANDPHNPNLIVYWVSTPMTQEEYLDFVKDEFRGPWSMKLAVYQLPKPHYFHTRRQHSPGGIEQYLNLEYVDCKSAFEVLNWTSSKRGSREIWSINIIHSSDARDKAIQSITTEVINACLEDHDSIEKWLQERRTDTSLVHPSTNTTTTTNDSTQVCDVHRTAFQKDPSLSTTHFQRCKRCGHSVDLMPPDLKTPQTQSVADRGLGDAANGSPISRGVVPPHSVDLPPLFPGKCPLSSLTDKDLSSVAPTKERQDAIIPEANVLKSSLDDNKKNSPPDNADSTTPASPVVATSGHPNPRSDRPLWMAYYDGDLVAAHPVEGSAWNAIYAKHRNPDPKKIKVVYVDPTGATKEQLVYRVG